jgi:HEAT repeat protein
MISSRKAATMRTTMAIAIALAATACASAPIAPPPTAIAPSFEDKMASILRLEDERIIRDPAPPAAPEPAPAPTVAGRGRRPPVAVPVAALPPSPPDLLRLLSDPEARVRRRAALAVGRVGLSEGVAPLVALLADQDPEVRQMSAFALGLVGDRSARDPLVSALGDQSALVQGSAAEALGLLGDKSAAGPIGRLAGQIVQSGVLNETPGDEVDLRRDLPASAFRLAVYALVRLNSFEALAGAVLDPSGQPRVRWWPVAYALQRIEDKRALPALLTLAKDAHPYTRAFAVKGLGALKDPAAVPTLVPLLAAGDRNVAIEAVRALGRIGDASAAQAVARLVQV